MLPSLTSPFHFHASIKGENDFEQPIDQINNEIMVSNLNPLSHCLKDL